MFLFRQCLLSVWKRLSTSWMRWNCSITGTSTAFRCNPYTRFVTCYITAGGSFWTSCALTTGTHSESVWHSTMAYYVYHIQKYWKMSCWTCREKGHSIYTCPYLDWEQRVFFAPKYCFYRVEGDPRIGCYLLDHRPGRYGLTAATTGSPRLHRWNTKKWENGSCISRKYETPWGSLWKERWGSYYLSRCYAYNRPLRFGKICGTVDNLSNISVVNDNISDYRPADQLLVSMEDYSAGTNVSNGILLSQTFSYYISYNLSCTRFLCAAVQMRQKGVRDGDASAKGIIIS